MEKFKEAQKKWWYRLIKVLYVLVFVISVSSVGLMMLGDSRPHDLLDTSNSTMTCLYGEQKVFSFQEARLGNVTALTPKGLQEICGTYKIEGNLYFADSSLYRFDKEYTQSGSWISSIFLSIVSATVVVLILETLRRIFYYIIFGEFWVRKLKNSNSRYE